MYSNILIHHNNEILILSINVSLATLPKNCLFYWVIIELLWYIIFLLELSKHISSHWLLTLDWKEKIWTFRRIFPYSFWWPVRRDRWEWKKDHKLWYYWFLWNQHCLSLWNDISSVCIEIKISICILKSEKQFYLLMVRWKIFYNRSTLSAAF